MKDFSLFYGPVRSWLPVVAMAVLAMIVFVNQTAGSDAECNPAQSNTSSDCVEPLLGERQLLGNDGGLDVSPTDASTDDGAEPEFSPWDGFEPPRGEVPFVSLQPSPEPMTEAGEELVRSAGSTDGP